MYPKVASFVVVTFMAMFIPALMFSEGAWPVFQSAGPYHYIAALGAGLILLVVANLRLSWLCLLKQLRKLNMRAVHSSVLPTSSPRSSAGRQNQALLEPKDIRGLLQAIDSQQRNVICLLQSMPVGWLAFDSAGKLCASNDQARRLLTVSGEELDDLLAVPVSASGGAVDAPTSIERALLLMGISPSAAGAIVQKKKIRFEGRSPAGLRLWSTWLSLSADRGKQAIAGVLVFDDVTGLYGLRETRDELVSYLRHDFRTPLASITAVLDKLMREPQTAYAEQYMAMQQMRGLVDRALDLSDQMLLLSRASGHDTPQPQPLTLGEIVDQACSDVQLKYQVQKVRVRPALDLDLMVMGDYSLLYRAALNLVDNAMKFSPYGSEVDVVLVACEGHAVLKVRDHGPGVSTGDALPSSSPDGFGLGLRLVQRVAVAHGGRFCLTNARTGGASAVLVLPRIKSAPQKSQPSNGVKSASAEYVMATAE